jgi:fatty-acyl-CoA synthase
MLYLEKERNFSAAELNEFLATRFAKFWIPDGYHVIDAIPKTSVGKFLKSALREKFLQEHK